MVRRTGEIRNLREKRILTLVQSALASEHGIVMNWTTPEGFIERSSQISLWKERLGNFCLSIRSACAGAIESRFTGPPRHARKAILLKRLCHA